MPGCALHQNKDSIVQPKRVSKRGILKFYLLGPDNNIEKAFYEYLTEKLKYRDVTCLILKLLA